MSEFNKNKEISIKIGRQSCEQRRQKENRAILLIKMSEMLLVSRFFTTFIRCNHPLPPIGSPHFPLYSLSITLIKNLNNQPAETDAKILIQSVFKGRLWA